MKVDTYVNPTSNGVVHMNGDAKLTNGDAKPDDKVNIADGDTGSPYGFPGATFEVAFFDLGRPEEFLELCHYDGFHPGTTILPKGHVKAPGLRPLPCDMVYERDVALKMRDGCTLYTDVFRPVGDEKVPAIHHQ
jgi:predicted acyl esterase